MNWTQSGYAGASAYLHPVVYATHGLLNFPTRRARRLCGSTPPHVRYCVTSIRSRIILNSKLWRVRICNHSDDAGPKSGHSHRRIIPYRTLSPVSEALRSGENSFRFSYEGERVTRTAMMAVMNDTTVTHMCAMPVFHFNELDLVVSSLPLCAGHSAIVPSLFGGDRHA